jgi:hypothetical protein
MVYESFAAGVGTHERVDFGGFDGSDSAKQSCDHHAMHFKPKDCFQPGASALSSHGLSLAFTEFGY